MKIFEKIYQKIIQKRKKSTFLVGINGFDGSGKTKFSQKFT